MITEEASEKTNKILLNDYYMMPDRMRVAMLVLQFEEAMTDAKLLKVWKNWNDEDDAYVQRISKQLAPGFKEH